MNRKMIFTFLFCILSACEQPLPPSLTEYQQPQDQDGLNSAEAQPVVVRARAKLNLLLGADGSGKGEILAVQSDDASSDFPEIEILAGQSGSTDVSVTLPVSTSYNLDLTNFTPSPVISNASISFGNLKIANTFYDNNIKVCGQSGNGACTTALIRAYTTQAATVINPGDGIWNATDGYGVPLYISNSGAVEQTIRYSSAQPSTLQSISFPGNQRVLTASDWQINNALPGFNVRADFTLAGAGLYAATIVIEYALQ
jgi:hypothetical protein